MQPIVNGGGLLGFDVKTLFLLSSKKTELDIVVYVAERSRASIAIHTKIQWLPKPPVSLTHEHSSAEIESHNQIRHSVAIDVSRLGTMVACS